MYGLIDCNNFYASCERVFNPSLNGRPVVVLSNNDGCVIARSNESKQLGIKMGVPAYQIKEEVRRHDIAVFSSNYTLYGDMSRRVMGIVAELCPQIEVYSIDEAFIDFGGVADVEAVGRRIVQAVFKGTGIPVSLGIAPTKTLAKVANKFAKKYSGYKQVCVIDTDEKRIKALQLTDVADVWGIGRRHTRRLTDFGVHTALDFARLSHYWVRKNMTVTGLRTWLELNGESCIGLELMPPKKQQICTSRAFGGDVPGSVGLSEAVAPYSAACAAALLEPDACPVALRVFLQPHPGRPDLPQYFCNTVVRLPVPSSVSFVVVHQALEALKVIFRPGFSYKKAGVIITEITPDVAIQQNLFHPNVNAEKHKRLMAVVDRLNSGFTTNKLVLAAQGTYSKNREWKLKRERLSPCYSTKLEDVIVVRS